MSTLRAFSTDFSSMWERKETKSFDVTIGHASPIMPHCVVLLFECSTCERLIKAIIQQEFLKKRAYLNTLSSEYPVSFPKMFKMVGNLLFQMVRVKIGKILKKWQVCIHNWLEFWNSVYTIKPIHVLFYSLILASKLHVCIWMPK